MNKLDIFYGHLCKKRDRLRIWHARKRDKFVRKKRKFNQQWKKTN